MSTTHQMTIQEWLDEMETHTDDPRWLNDNEDKLYQDISAGIYTPRVSHDTIKLLNQVYPYYALVRFQAEKWSRLLTQALLQAMELRDNEMLIQIYTHLGESQLIIGKSQSAHNSFETALDRAQEGEAQAAMLAAYIGLIRLQAFNLKDRYTADLFDKAIDLSRSVGDEVLTAELYQSISAAYLVGKDYEKALGYGQTAYACWLRKKHPLNLAKSAYLVSAALRAFSQHTVADTWLEIAEDAFQVTPYNRQDTLIAYARGVQYGKENELEASAQWLTIALREAIEIGWSHYIALAYHGLGITQTKQGNFQEAELNLKQALNYWEKLDDSYEIAAMHHALGWLQMCIGNFDEAQAWLTNGLTACAQIPNLQQRAVMEEIINETLKEIP